MSNLEGQFSLEKLMADFEAMHNSVNQRQDIDIATFIAAYTEIYRLFGLFGKGMVFVKNDVSSKITDIENASRGKYQTIIQMMDDEVRTHGLSNSKKDEHAGTRQLLRLVRALEFLMVLLQNLATTQDELNDCTRQAYDNTIARYHSFAVKKSAQLAFKVALPYKAQFIQDLHYSGEPMGAIQKLTGDIKPVHDFLHGAYVQRNINDLP